MSICSNTRTTDLHDDLSAAVVDIMSYLRFENHYYVPCPVTSIGRTRSIGRPQRQANGEGVGRKRKDVRHAMNELLVGARTGFTPS